MNQDATFFRAVSVCLLCLALVALPMLVGCAPKTHSLDDRIQEWIDKEEQYRAFTPTKVPPEVVSEVYVEPITILDDVDVDPVRPLPTHTLNFLNVIQDQKVADVLMLLARSANVNLVLAPGVHNIDGVTSFKFQDVKWDNAFRGLLRSHGLAYFWEGDVLQVYSRVDIDNDIELMEKLRKHQTLTTERGRPDPLVTSVIKLRYITGSGGGKKYEHQTKTERKDDFSATERQSSTKIEETTAITDRLMHFLSRDEWGYTRGSIHLEPDTNSLVVHATRTDTTKILRLLEHIDQPRPQVHIKAHIVQTSKDTARDLGIQWGGRQAGVNAGQPWMVAPGVGQPTGAFPGEGPAPSFNIGQGSGGMAGNFPANLTEIASGLTMGFIMGGANYLEVQLTALQQDRKLNILSSPSITTLDNLPAFTETGEKVPYVSMDDAGNPKVEFEDAVLRLEITPNVIDANQLRMSILVKNDRVDDVRSVQGNPFIYKKETQTSLVAKSGETIVISGLTEEISGNQRQGVPGLMNIPGLGALFRRDKQDQEMSEMLIFITATILPERPVSLLTQPSQNTP
jgi:type IV pilus assembly protein PilQ